MKQTISGRFNEILGDGPIVWNDPPPRQYFKLPTPDQDAAQAIAARMAASEARFQAARRAKLAPVHFNVPKGK